MTIDIETIMKYSPIFVFHKQEKYFPCSIEHILENSTLHGAISDSSDLRLIKNPTQNDLNEYSNSRSFIEINESQYPGLPIGSAPIYYSIQKFDSFIEIHYLLLFAFRGSHSFTVETEDNKEINFIGHNYGQHQGELSRVTVRLVLIDDMRNDYKVFQVGFENDRHMFFDTSDNVELIGEDTGSPLTHPLVHIGLYGHNCWNRVIRTPIIVKDHGPKCFAISCLGEDSPCWKPYESGESSFKQVGFKKVKTEYSVIEPEVWANFKGKIGKDMDNSWTNTPTDLAGEPLSKKLMKELEFMESSQIAFEGYSTNLKTNLKHGKSPVGLATNYFVYPDKDSSQQIEDS